MIDSAALLQKLVREPSVFEQEHGIVSLIEQQLDWIGIARHSVPFDAWHLHTLPNAQLPFSKIPDRRNVVAKIPGSTMETGSKSSTPKRPEASRIQSEFDLG